ncbi:MAG: insulinase family protein [Clostridiales bacterium]|jgi:predicted Zn-dependent peptidase|nr:insulinase family protein [Clostridiales bacterium]
MQDKNMFKTITKTHFFLSPLTRKTATYNSLLAEVLRRATPSFPTTKKLENKLQELYSAKISFSTYKRGETHVIAASLEQVADEFLPEPIAEISGNILNEAVFNQTSFNHEYVEQEKANLKLRIAAIINNKAQYAQKRCIEEMFGDNPYAINSDGYADIIDGITPEGLYDYYKNTFLNLPYATFTSNDETVSVIPNDLPPLNFPMLPIAKAKNITEKEDLNQSKLSMGFTTGIGSDEEHDYFILTVFNAIFGGSPYSKLFNNVREKLSLAYSVSSQVERFKGAIFVNAGIDANGFKPAYDEIIKQLDEIKNGNFTESEISAAKEGITNNLKSICDMQFAYQDFLLRQHLAGRPTDEQIEQIINGVNNVTKDEICDIAKRMQLHTVFLLEGSVS